MNTNIVRDCILSLDTSDRFALFDITDDMIVVEMYEMLIDNVISPVISYSVDLSVTDVTAFHNRYDDVDIDEIIIGDKVPDAFLNKTIQSEILSDATKGTSAAKSNHFKIITSLTNKPQFLNIYLYTTLWVMKRVGIDMLNIEYLVGQAQQDDTDLLNDDIVALLVQ